jgi:protein SCO1
MASEIEFGASGVGHDFRCGHFSFEDFPAFNFQRLLCPRVIVSRLLASIFFFGIAFAGLALAGCGNPPGGASTAAPRIFHLEGTVVSVDKDKQQLVVSHKEIPGLMAAMTMGYPVAVDDTKMLDQVAPGDQITAEVVVDDSGARLRNIVIVKKGDGTPPAGPVALRSGPTSAAPGAALAADPVPDFTLINQDGKQIDLAQYRGKALLITFIYTRCPLPDQCPLMTHNFAVIEKDLAKTPSLYEKTRLLSISFDPQYDTPTILRNYARGFGEDKFDHWEFAALPAAETRDAAKFFDMLINEQQGQINHSTCTAIIAPDGSLYRLYPGTDWKPEAVLTQMTASLIKYGSGAGSGPVQERNETAAR